MSLHFSSQSGIFEWNGHGLTHDYTLDFMENWLVGYCQYWQIRREVMPTLVKWIRSAFTSRALILLITHTR